MFILGLFYMFSGRLKTSNLVIQSYRPGKHDATTNNNNCTDNSVWDDISLLWNKHIDCIRNKKISILGDSTAFRTAKGNTETCLVICITIKCILMFALSKNSMTASFLVL